MAAVKKKGRVRSQSFDSLSSLKKSVKGGGRGASGKVAYIPEDPLLVRFLQEPNKWVEYFEHYNGPNSDPRYSPCVTDCERCEDGNKAAKKYLANVLDVTKNAVVALKMPTSLVEQLLKFEGKYGTVIDRDYELSREGSGLDTTYSAIPESPTRVSVSRYAKSLFDLEDLLEQWVDEEDGDDEDEEEEEEPRTARKSASSRSASRNRLKDHPGGVEEFRPKRRPASTRGVEDDDEDEPPKTKRRTSPTKPTPKAAAKRTVTRRSR